MLRGRFVKRTGGTFWTAAELEPDLLEGSTSLQAEVHQSHVTQNVG
jgi:hypothetical protein